MITAYTLGRTVNYEIALEHPKGCQKCEGGWAFQTIDDAEAYLKVKSGVDFGDFILDDSFSVYTLSLPNGWDKDVDQCLGEDDANHLLINVKLGRL